MYVLYPGLEFSLSRAMETAAAGHIVTVAPVRKIGGRMEGKWMVR